MQLDRKGRRQSVDLMTDYDTNVPPSSPSCIVPHSKDYLIFNYPSTLTPTRPPEFSKQLIKQRNAILGVKYGEILSSSPNLSSIMHQQEATIDAAKYRAHFIDYNATININEIIDEYSEEVNNNQKVPHSLSLSSQNQSTATNSTTTTATTSSSSYDCYSNTNNKNNNNNNSISGDCLFNNQQENCNSSNTISNIRAESPSNTTSDESVFYDHDEEKFLNCNINKSSYEASILDEVKLFDLTAKRRFMNNESKENSHYDGYYEIYASDGYF